MKDQLANWLMRIFGVNWKTNVNGWLLLMCGGESAASALDIAHLLPPDYQAKLQALCMVFAAFGLLGAKDNNVTNSIVATEAKKVPGS